MDVTGLSNIEAGRMCVGSGAARVRACVHICAMRTRVLVCGQGVEKFKMQHKYCSGWRARALVLSVLSVFAD